MFEKIDVRSEIAHPLYKYLVSEKPFEELDVNHPLGERLQKGLIEL